MGYTKEGMERGKVYSYTLGYELWVQILFQFI